ncbi:unnamed protein product [Echinostoma caproni]|uniref:Uncharacterized protein n=1 Tax=Echinostoma caproni TaxID=27848 RepID=A0A183ADI9_9TREM|nr:unnamed protein product [Echinostoma caproni]
MVQCPIPLPIFATAVKLSVTIRTNEIRKLFAMSLSKTYHQFVIAFWVGVTWNDLTDTESEMFYLESEANMMLESELEDPIELSTRITAS